jgi:cyclase
MYNNRIIPALLLRNKGLVKSVQFNNHTYVGDPINAIKIFNEKEVDELLLLDIMATKYNREPDYDFIEQLASECFMPLCYGGGIKNVDSAMRLFSLGVEKVSIQTAFFDNLDLVTDIAKRVGSQSVVVSIDIKKDFFGRYKLYSSATNKIIDKAWEKHIIDAIEAGAGEILINSVDRDGTRSGLDLSVIKKASSMITVPLIAMGGVGSLEHIKQGIQHGASAIAAGAFFVFYGPHRAVLISYPNQKEISQIFINEN